MNFRVPIVVSEHRESGVPVPILEAQPAFLPQFQRRGEKLSRVMERLAQDVREHLLLLTREGRSAEIAALATRPEVREESVRLRIELKSGTLQPGFLFLIYEAHGQRLAFTPAHPEVVFQLDKPESLAARAHDVFREFFREAERNERTELLREAGRASRQWLTEIELEMRLNPPKPKAKDEGFALFARSGEVSGAAELERTGRCLDRLPPGELPRALCREEEVGELTRLLTASDRRPVLLLGPPQCGKSTLVHEFIQRRAGQRAWKFGRGAAVWLLSPQRLVSGMSYVGQWEERLLAILGEAKQRDHILYFDDLAGLWLAGQTSHSSTSMAHLLKPWIERGDVRLLAELSGEQWRVLRELDRGFADLFHIVPVREPGARDNLRILLGVQRSLEQEHRCSFELDALPAVLDLQRRHAPELCFPGKAAGFLRNLASKHARGVIDRAAVLREFQAKTGLALPFLETDRPLLRTELEAGLRRTLVGQDEAVGALADALSLARARLNDPRRPLAAFLFLGPTGVGKTQCAKAAAAYLFGDPTRLLRFDMNEFVSSDAVARLTGTFAEPEGLLTSAVRQQPFCVLLLDEIEKAHPEVFDLLLQVLGEGRLTDALGRTTSFANALIVLTSNLGVREAGRNLGFRTDGADDSTAHFVRAAEAFFRPEFVNRLDRVVPFARLSRAEVERIADSVLAEVLAREGLRQRHCVLRVDPAARARLVDLGFHPELGARALKRAVERHLVQPVAARLAALPVGRRCIISVRLEAGEFAVEVQALGEASWRGLPPALAAGDPTRFERQLKAAFRRISETAARLAPDGAVSLGSLDPAHARYFLLREVLTGIEERWPRAAATAAAAQRLPWTLATERRESRPAQLRANEGFVQEVAEAESVERETVESALDAHWASLLRELALADLILRSALEDERVLLLRDGAPVPEATPAVRGKKAGKAPAHFLAGLLGFEVTLLAAHAILIEGPGARTLTAGEVGIVVNAATGALTSQIALALGAGEDARRALKARGSGARDQEIIRVLEAGQLCDLRTGDRIELPARPENLCALCLAALPWPREVLA